MIEQKSDISDIKMLCRSGFKLLKFSFTHKVKTKYTLGTRYTENWLIK